MLPLIFVLLYLFLNFITGMKVEGVFRISGSASLIEYYKDRFDQGLSPLLLHYIFLN